jgi:hypothetical protein
MQDREALVAAWEKKIRAMDHAELAELQRFAPIGHVVFVEPTLHALFAERLPAMGGMTT